MYLSFTRFFLYVARNLEVNLVTKQFGSPLSQPQYLIFTKSSKSNPYIIVTSNYSSLKTQASKAKSYTQGQGTPEKKMGIIGLLPFLKKASKNSHIKHYSGHTAAVDGLGWLHKGAFGCAVKLGLGEPTDAYVVYCMKYVNVLLSNGVRPVIVFDGRNLPAKAITNKKRREARAANRKKAQDCMRRGDKKGSWEYFVKSIEITHEMIHELIKVLRKHHIDYVIAPYEADAQLAYLSRNGFVDLVITEDSDLTLFGCPKILFKLKMDGHCVEFSQAKIHLCMGVPAGKFEFERFRQMSILSGCDYLESLPGIGLGRAQKLFKMITTSTDIKEILKSIPSTLNLNIEVPDEYIEGFIEAEKTFLYQLAFDPVTRKLVPLNPYVSGVDPDDMPYAGLYDLNDEDVLGMALGNLNTKTLERVGKYDVNNDKGYANNENSIWSKKYIRTSPKNSMKDLKKGAITTHTSTKGLKASVSIKNLAVRKRPLAVDEDKMNVTDDIDSELLALYAEDDKNVDVPKNLTKLEEESDDELEDPQQHNQGRQSKSKRVKISNATTPTSLSLRNSDTYNMRTTRNTAHSSIFDNGLGHEASDEPDANDTNQQNENKDEEKEEVPPFENSPRLGLRKKINPFLKSPDIGLRAKAKMTRILRSSTSPMRSNNFENQNQGEEYDDPPYVELIRVDEDRIKERQENPVCLVEKNFVYDLDDRLIVKSQYFRPLKDESQNESAKTEDLSQTTAKLTGSQFSIYSIDREGFGDSESQNLNGFLDAESQDLKTEFLESENEKLAQNEVKEGRLTKMKNEPPTRNDEIINLSDEDNDDDDDEPGTRSSYFNNQTSLRKSPRHVTSSGSAPKASPSSSSSSSKSLAISNQSRNSTMVKGNSGGKKIAVKSPGGRKGQMPKLNGTCRQHGLRKVPTVASSGQKTIKEMFSYKPKAKI